MHRHHVATKRNMYSGLCQETAQSVFLRSELKISIYEIQNICYNTI